MKTLIKYLSVLLIITLSFSCSENDFFPCIKGSGQVVTQNRALPSFSAVDFRMDGDVDVRYSTQHSIEISGYENQNSQIRADVSNGKLVVESKQCLRNTQFHFVIYTPEVESFKLQGSSSATITMPAQNSALNLDISGSGNITSTVAAPTITARVSGSGNLSINGTTNNFIVKISGSGHVDGYQLTAKNVDASLSGSGFLKTLVLDKLDAEISGSGIVYYKGSPIVTSRVSGSGKLIKQ